MKKPKHTILHNDGKNLQDDKIKDILNAHQFNRRKFLQGSALAAAALSIGPFFLRQSSAMAAGDVWKIGALFPLTGPLAYGGNEGLLGAQIARDIVNEAGGADTLAGKKKIEFALSNAPDQTAATNEMNRLISNEKVTLVTGSFASAIAYTASAFAERKKVIYWECTAIVADLTTRGFKYLFRVEGSANEAGIATVRFAVDYIAPKVGKKPEDLTVAMIWEDGTLGTSIHKSTIDLIKSSGLKLVLDEPYSAKSTDLSPPVLKLKATKPDIIICASAGTDAVILGKTMREMDINPIAILGTSAGWSQPNLGPGLGKSVNGIFSSDFLSEVHPKALLPAALVLRDEFMKRYHAMKGQPPSPTCWSAFAGNTLLFNHVLPKIKILDPEEIREAALSLDMPLGSLPNGYGAKFTPHDQSNGGQNERAPCLMLQWLDGVTQSVYPEQFAIRSPEMVPLPPWKDRM